MKTLWTFLYAVLAGVSIGIGGTAFLAIENTVVGALFFTVGLFTIVGHGFHLYTGRVCYVFERDRKYAWNVPVIWLGNLAGTWLMGTIIRNTRMASLVTRAETICQTKLGDDLLSIFLLAILCNIMIFIAVDGYNTCPHQVGKYLALFLGVAGFILCGFEHCVANMFYFTMGGVWGGKALLYLLVMSLGNAVGGVIFPGLRQLKAKTEAK